MTYNKPVLPDFASDENTIELIEIWCDWRGDNLFPSRDEVELRDISKYLQSTVLYQIEAPDKIMIRYFGGRMMDYVGGDHTGKNYLDFADEDQKPLRWGRHAEMVGQPCGSVWTITDRRVSKDTKLNAIGLSLPLGAPGEYEQASQILQVLFPFEGTLQPMYESRTVDKIHFPRDFQFLDIGAGVGDKKLET